MLRARAWLVVSPVVAAGVLVGHALAYRITSTPTGALHAYLAHAPEVLLVLALSGLVLAGVGRSRDVPAARVFPAVAVTTFVLQEHIERLVHDGALPVLVTSPAFVVGLALQIPFALLAWALARWLLEAACDVFAPPIACFPPYTLQVLPLPSADLDSIELPLALGRGPPPVLRPR